MAGGEERMVLHDYVMSQSSGITSSVVSSMVEAHKFELRPALVTFVDRD